TMTDVSTIQITVTVPASAYVKVGGTGSFTGNGTSILTDSAGVIYNKGSIQQISGATTLTYYARFEIVYNPTVESTVYLSFVAEDGTSCPDAFSGRNAGAGKNGGKFGNTISTGFKYSLNTMTDVSTIQITVTVPASAYVKVGGTGSFTGNGTSILTDSAGVTYNKGSIQQISGATTLTYYWDASGLQANTTYGFIIDNLYAPGATATITVNGTAGTKVTNDNGVVNTAASAYRANSHYPK
ncbi:MAG: hypothetical protein SPD95_09050, partial [Candidatus Faecousia sp.]|nr:hypothetical protein [Candidatus Faecousia sp.]